MKKIFSYSKFIYSKNTLYLLNQIVSDNIFNY